MKQSTLKFCRCGWSKRIKGCSPPCYIGLAKKDNAELICLTALQPPSFYGWSAIESPQEWQKRDRLQREEWINNNVQTANENKIKIQDKIVESPMSADGAIVNYADKENVDLIVVGTGGRTGFAKKLLGSVGFDFEFALVF